MYRTLLPLVLCASTVVAAPQQNSNITYVKRQPDLGQLTPELKLLQRESRIENLPLTIPANVDTQPKLNTEEKEKTEAAETVKAVKKPPIYNYSDRIYSIKTKPKTTTTTSTEKNISNEEVKEIESDNSEDILPESNNSDIVPAESILNDRVATNDVTELSSEANATPSDEYVTEKYEEETTLTTVVEEETTKGPTARQLAKLSYFEKSTSGSFSQNLIGNGGKKRFRSRCRCEKIWNCAKLQITVPRCPDEYFMCCS
ncbi:hypothetical protein PYW08_008229 [Mythimna loreyi]|uniref:Uncharacterized protein n=1 Tax=Mythimna loreyi TaxID=667449 RepID=A0ACC2QDE1_9NEOP|nr:hypothetical protein PYW08_008229 [Mythimna loreyi]